MSLLIGLLTLNPAAARYFADAAREPTPLAAGSRAPDPDTTPVVAAAPQTPATTTGLDPVPEATAASAARTAGTDLAPASSATPRGGASPLLTVLAARSAASTPSTTPRSVNHDALLAALTKSHAELHGVRERITEVQAQLDDKLARIDHNLHEARRAEANIAHAASRVRQKQRTSGLLGALATGLTAMVFPPAISVVGLGALSRHISLDQAIGAERRALAEKQSTLRQLEQGRDALRHERGALYARVSTLDAEIATVDRALHATQTLEGLTAAHRRAHAALAAGRGILDDGLALAEQATALGLEVEALRAGLTADLVVIEGQIAALDEHIERSIVGLALSVVGAGTLANLSSAQVVALKTALSATRFFQTAEADRPAWLAQALAGVVGGPEAARLVAATLTLLGGPDDRAAAKAALLAGEGLLTLAQRAWMRELLETPEVTAPLAGVVKALLALASGDRDRAIASFGRLIGA